MRNDLFVCDIEWHELLSQNTFHVNWLYNKAWVKSRKSKVECILSHKIFLANDEIICTNRHFYSTQRHQQHPQCKRLLTNMYATLNCKGILNKNMNINYLDKSLPCMLKHNEAFPFANQHAGQYSRM